MCAIYIRVGQDTGRAAAMLRSYRLAPDVVALIDRYRRAEATTGTAIVEAAVRAYGGRQDARLAAIEARLAAIEARLEGM